jgi:hypothetical protein
MSHHTRVRANSAAWATGTVTQAEWEKFDANLFKSINGDEGGVWAPSTAIEIGGAGLDVSGPLESSGGATFNGAATFNAGANFTVGGLTVGTSATFNNSADFNNPVNFDAPITVNSISTFGNTATFNGQVIVGNSAADSFDCTSQAQFYSETTLSSYVLITSTGTLDVQGDLAVNGPAEFNDGVEFNNQVDFDADVTIGSSSTDALLVHASGTFFGPVIFNDTVELLDTAVIAAPLTFSGAGRILMRTGVTSDVSTSYSPTVANMWRVAPTTLSGVRVYTISNTGASDGDWLWFGIGPQGFQLSFEDHLGSPLISFTAGQQGYALFVRQSGTWRLFGYTRH